MTSLANSRSKSKPSPAHDPVSLKPTSRDTRNLEFPESGYVGLGKDFAEIYDLCYESPKEFLYADFLAFVGTALSGRVRVDVDVAAQPRLYILKISPPGWKRKSWSTHVTRQFMGPAFPQLQTSGPSDFPQVIYGAGSGEGLAKALQPDGDRETQRVILYQDEYRRFETKAGLEGSSLRHILGELYEGNVYANCTLNPIYVPDAHLGFISNTTDDALENLLNASETVDLGLLSGLFVIWSDAEKYIALPQAPPKELLHPSQQQLRAYFAALPRLEKNGRPKREVLLPLTEAAKELWTGWYDQLERSEQTTRLDGIGLRLMAILTFTSGKSEVDESLVEATLGILEYERRIRLAFRPSDGITLPAKIEQTILNALRKHGPLRRRDLDRYAHASRYGLEAFAYGLTALQKHGRIELSGGRYVARG